MPFLKHLPGLERQKLQNRGHRDYGTSVFGSFPEYCRYTNVVFGVNCMGVLKKAFANRQRLEASIENINEKHNLLKRSIIE